MNCRPKYSPLLWLLFLIFPTSLWAHSYKDYLQKAATKSEIKEMLVQPSQWVSYPNYTNRAGWNKLMGAYKQDIIKEGEQFLKYTWQVIKATDYLEFERSGSRKISEDIHGANNKAVVALVLAELAEGKGRFIDQIINGIWQACDMVSWASAAHLPVQKLRTSLPDYREHIIDLGGSDMGSFFSWTYYFLHEEFDKVTPIVSPRLRQNIQDRILTPYITRNDFNWQAVDALPTKLVNNWNPWCNFNVLTAFLLLENDKEVLANAVYKTMVSVDKFINYSKADGACEEGPSYWGHAAGKMYDYLQILYTATNGKINIFNKPMIKNMGEYIVRSYVGNDWVVNFADASAKGGGDAGLIYRYGKMVNSVDMQQFASYLLNRSTANAVLAGRDLFRTLENLQYNDDAAKIVPKLDNNPFTWYPETEFCYMKNTAGFFVATKGGFNAESHNHNDIGSFSLYVNTIPMIIDIGVGTYTRQTFSSERYSIWTMQSNYHNLPVINGKAQQYGRNFKAESTSFEPSKNLFQLSLKAAYPKQASIEQWKRSIKLDEKNGLMVTDDFKLENPNEANVLNYMTWAKPDLTTAGKIILSKNGTTLAITYNAKAFEPIVETIKLDDSRLSNVWGGEVYRLSLKATTITKAGKYTVTFNTF